MELVEDNNNEQVHCQGYSESPDWLCPICNTSDHFPLMITICGHSFCEECLEDLDNCPTCRASFTLYDCKPNFSLGSKSKYRKTVTIENQLVNVIRSKQQKIESETNRILKHVIDFLEEAVKKNPYQTEYLFAICDDFDKDILNVVREKLAKQEIDFKISKNNYATLKFTKYTHENQNTFLYWLQFRQSEIQSLLVLTLGGCLIGLTIARIWTGKF